jgi:predicted PurR-regulated permease PerM
VVDDTRGKGVREILAKGMPAPLWLGLLALGLSLWILIQNLGLIFEVVGLLFGALLLALGLEPLTGRLEHRGIPRSLSVILFYLFLLFVILGIGELLLPLFNAELSTLQSQGPALWDSLSSYLSSTPLIRQLVPSTSDAAGVISNRFDTLLQAVFGTVGSLGNAGLDIGVVFILAYFFVTSKDSLIAKLPGWIPGGDDRDVLRITGRVLEGLGRWVRAQPLVMLYFAAGFSLSLTLLKVPFALAIGLVGGLLSLVPLLGAVVGALLGVLSALTVKPLLALWVLLIFTALTELEIHLLAPAVFGRALRLHPAVVLMAMFIGTKVSGLIGLLYSVPIAVVGMVLLDELRPPLGGAAIRNKE